MDKKVIEKIVSKWMTTKYFTLMDHGFTKKEAFENLVLNAIAKDREERGDVVERLKRLAVKTKNGMLKWQENEGEFPISCYLIADGIGSTGWRSSLWAAILSALEAAEKEGS